MNVLYITADTKLERNSVIWRCEVPADALNRSGRHAARLCFITDWVDGRFDADSAWADVIVIQRNLVAGALATAYLWMAKGKRVLVDLDDAYDRMPQDVISATFWINRHQITQGKTVALGFDPLEHLTWGVKSIDGMITPSQVIVDDWLLKTDNAFLAPNYPHAGPYLEAAAAKAPLDGAITIGWGGGGSHLSSWKESGVLPALARVLLKRKNVRALIVGPQIIAEWVKRAAWAVHDKVDFVPWSPHTEWPQHLAKLDVGLAPLYGQYDMRRSWLKAVEYSLMGIPWVGTDYGAAHQPYAGWERHLVRNQANRWEERLLDIVDNYGAHCAQAAEEQEFARHLDVDEHVEDLVKVYGG